MIAFGSTLSPLVFCETLQNKKQKFSINSVDKSKIAIFLGLDAFTALRKKTIPRRIVIFDTKERLQMVQNLQFTKGLNIENAVDYVLNSKIESEPLWIKNIDYVDKILQANIDDNTSFVHLYNTNLYNITQVLTRDAVKKLYRDLILGNIDDKKFLKEIEKIYPKRGKSLEAVLELVDLTKTELFLRFKQAIKLSIGKSDKEVTKIAEKQNVAAFDLRYFLSSLKK